MTKYQRYAEYKDSGVEWLGKIPSHWKVGALRFCFTDIKNGSTATQIEETIDALPITRIESISTGEINYEKVGYVSRNTINYVFKIDEGDILLSHINSLSMVGNVALKRDSSLLYHGMNLLRLIPNRNKFDPKYLFWLLKSKYFRNAVECIAKPAINQASVSIDSLKNINLFIPLQIEQTQIANFLDHETAKIDSLIEKQQKLIELLKEKRQAVISHAVTKGLDPNVPMKDSGVEWLGEVPENWERKSLNYLLAQTVDNRGRTPPIVDEGIPMVEVSQVAGNGIYTSDNYSKFVTQKAYDEFVRSDVKENDILFVTVGATFGKTCLVPPCPNFFIAQNIVGFRCIEDVDPRFLMFLLSSSIFKEAISATNKSSTIDNIKVSDLVKTKVVIPPFIEQERISNHILKITNKYEKLVLEAYSFINLLKERRTALISAAVTGKIDVRNWQAPNATEREMEVST